MNKSKKVIPVIAFAVFCTLAGFTLYKWVSFGTIDGGSVFLSLLSFSQFFNWLNWSNREGNGEKDELDRHIETQSAKIGYFVLMILAGLVLFISEGVSNFNDIKNYPLLTVVGLTFVTLPITEYIYSKKYK
ncbi:MULTISPECIES: hypothetical protein [Bacillus]|uniref:Group-specific protein n=2 Tax=Bacillus TaxID=1386 RepID=A0A0M3RAR8_9BACI|nr:MULTISPECIES: hypothetical protein [Bacillus]ALC83676.1 hypothetical protein AM592_20740 [Bacillus gobiensis]MBP1082710.1 nicotinamide riboside transporter PnuC [Bacillus capparidis]MED1097071.1 hypothetical protein [Bacillus capparidis]